MLEFFSVCLFIVCLFLLVQIRSIIHRLEPPPRDESTADKPKLKPKRIRRLSKAKTFGVTQRGTITETLAEIYDKGDSR